MKKLNLKSVFFIVMIIGMFFFPLMIEMDSNQGSINFIPQIEDIIIPKTSYFNNSAAPIFINGSDTRPGAHNWTWAEGKDWCTKVSNVYYIENLTINGQNSSSCIKIINSDVNLIIRNCSVFNSSKESAGEYNGGIELVNVNNTKIYENTISFNNGYGIKLASSSGIIHRNITILENDINNNTLDGVSIGSYKQCIISQNNISSCMNGIFLFNCNNFSISTNNFLYIGVGIDSNTINDIFDYGVGIYLYYSNNISITNNNATYNEYDGVFIEGNSRSNTLSGNDMIECGLRLEFDSLLTARTTNIDTTNTVNGNLLYYKESEIALNEAALIDPGQIFLIDCNNSLISGIEVVSSSIGISLLYCNNITLFNGTFSNNSHYGMYINNGNNNNLTGNLILSNNEDGIYLEESVDNYLINNRVEKNSKNGILLSDSDTNDFIGNNLSKNLRCGMFLTSCFSNNIIDNKLFNNSQMGVAIDSGCNLNKIYSNCFVGNEVSNAQDNGTNNQWDNGVKGNFWDDYMGSDGNCNNIGDIAYDIDGTSSAQDNYPLMYCGAEPIPTDPPSPPGPSGGNIPGYDLFIYIGTISLISLIIKRKRQFKKK